MAIRSAQMSGNPPASPPAPAARDITVPIDVGMFDTISVLEAYKVRYAVPQFIKDMFFSARDYSNANAIEIDVKRGGRRLAPFILPLEGQVVGRRLPFIRTFVEAPTLAPARVITLREAGRPFWGETPYDFITPEQRIANMFAEDTEEMDDEIARTEEWMCAETMFNGQFTINYRNKTSQVVDYGFTNITALGTPWTDPASNPFDDLHAAQQGLNAAGYSGNVAIYGTKAWQALWRNPNVREYMRNTVGFVPISGYTMPEVTPAGVARAPSFTYPIMENWVYSGTYTVNDQPVGLVPEDKVLIGSSDVRNRLIYGVVIQIEQADGQWHSYMGDRVPKVECNVNKNLYMHTMTARPVPVPLDLMAWTVLQGVLPAASETAAKSK